MMKKYRVGIYRAMRSGRMHEVKGEETSADGNEYHPHVFRKIKGQAHEKKKKLSHKRHRKGVMPQARIPSESMIFPRRMRDSRRV
jgi:hypothetical protein